MAQKSNKDNSDNSAVDSSPPVAPERKAVYVALRDFTVLLRHFPLAYSKGDVITSDHVGDLIKLKAPIVTSLA